LGLLCLYLLLQCCHELHGLDDKPAEVELRIDQRELTTEATRRRVQVAPGGTVAVRLEQKATGYLWELTARDEMSLKPLGKPKVERTENKPGAPEYLVYRFQVMKAGSATFTLARPFGNRDAKQVIVSVETKR
jgi:predicted secreted protein